RRVRVARAGHRPGRYDCGPAGLPQNSHPAPKRDRRLHGRRVHEHRRLGEHGGELERDGRQHHRHEQQRQAPLRTLQGRAESRPIQGRRDRQPRRRIGHGGRYGDGGAGVSGAGAGSATITATSEGQSGTSSVTVTFVPVASVTVNPPSASVQVGQTVQLTATPRDANGNALPGRTVTWATTNTTVATVNGQGLVTTKVVGEQ